MNLTVFHWLFSYTLIQICLTINEVPYLSPAHRVIQCVPIKKKRVIHIQRPVVLKSIDLISKEQLIFFPLVLFLHHAMYVTHDQVHCHWRWQCHVPLFASFGNWDRRLCTVNAFIIIIGISNEWVPRYQTLHTEIAFKVWVIVAVIRICLGNNC